MKSAIILDPEDMDDAEDIKGNTDYKYIWVKIPFNNFMTVFFEDRYYNVCLRITRRD